MRTGRVASSPAAGVPLARVSTVALGLLAVLVCALAPRPGVYAQSAPDPMASAECLKARESLEAAYRAATDRRDDTALKLQAARRQAAVVCLGRSGRAAAREPLRDAPAPQRTPPAASVPPVTPATPPAVPGTRSPAPGQATPPVTIQRPTLITTCDEGGCWGTDGARYNRAGSQLVGPRGACSLQGNVVNCP